MSGHDEPDGHEGYNGDDRRRRGRELDPWGNTRVRGSGPPPFPVDLLDGVS